MIKTKFVFAVSLVAMMAVSSAMAATAVTESAPTSGNGQAISGTTGTVGTVYDWSKWKGHQTNGIASVTYVNEAVDAAGNAAQWAENHAAAAGTAANSAAASARAAAQSATSANNALGSKQDILVPNTNIKGSGSVTVTKGTDGVITVSGTDNDTKYTLPNATASTLGGVKVGSNISVSSGTISVADADANTRGVAKLYTGTGTATDGSMTQKAVTDYVAAQVQSVSEGTATQLSALGQEISDLDDNKVDIAQGAANKAVITNGSGNITTGTIATNMIADGAVTVAKTTGLYGVIPSGSQGNTSATANIWVE